MIITFFCLFFLWCVGGRGAGGDCKTNQSKLVQFKCVLTIRIRVMCLIVIYGRVFNFPNDSSGLLSFLMFQESPSVVANVNRSSRRSLLFWRVYTHSSDRNRDRNMRRKNGTRRIRNPLTCGTFYARSRTSDCARRVFTSNEHHVSLAFIMVNRFSTCPSHGRGFGNIIYRARGSFRSSCVERIKQSFVRETLGFPRFPGAQKQGSWRRGDLLKAKSGNPRPCVRTYVRIDIAASYVEFWAGAVFINQVLGTVAVLFWIPTGVFYFFHF